MLDFIRVLRAHGGSWRYAHRILVHFLRFLFFEPFRLLDHALLSTRHRGEPVPDDPIFILGYYRSGTTHLQEVLLQDPQVGYLNFFEGFFSKGFLSAERLLFRPFNALIQAVGFKHPAHQIPFRFELPAEEDVAMVSGGFLLATNFGQLFPRSFRWYWEKTVLFDTATAEERALFAAEHASLVQRTWLANGKKRLVLKSPPHTGRVAFLKALYPKAKFVFIHRDPYLQFRSNLKLWGTFQDVCFQPFTEEQAREHVLWSFDAVLDRYEREKPGIPAGDLVEVRYERFLEAPMAELKRIYEALALPGFEAAAPRFQAYLDRTHGQNRDRYDLSERDLSDVETRWGRWISKWGYLRPGAKDDSAPPKRAANG